MKLKAVYFDFGYVLGYPKKNIEKKYLYLDWDGIKEITKDTFLIPRLRKNIAEKEIQSFFEKEIYNLFIHHEQTDLLDPKSNQLLLDKLDILFEGEINQELVDAVLRHVDTMKYIEIDLSSRTILNELVSKYKLSMITNMMLPGKLLRNKLNENGILDYFNTITVSSDNGFIKPREELFIRTLKKDGLLSDEVIFVGDTYKQDIIGAQKAGLKTIWLNNRNEPKEWAKDNLPNYEIKELKEILNII